MSLKCSATFQAISKLWVCICQSVKWPLEDENYNISFVLPRQIFRWSELVATIKEEIWLRLHTWCVVIDLHLSVRHLFLRKWRLSSAVSLGRTVLEKTVWPKRYQVQNAIISSRSFPTVLCQKNTTNISRIGPGHYFFSDYFLRKSILANFLAYSLNAKALSVKS